MQKNTSEINPTEVSFWVAITPPKTTHQAKSIVTAGKFPRLRNRDSLNAAKAAYKWAFYKHIPLKPVLGPCELELHVIYPHNVKTKLLERQQIWRHTSRPDSSNLAKTIEDILVELGFMEDDCNVSDLIVRKRTGPTPGVFVRITTLEKIT